MPRLATLVACLLVCASAEAQKYTLRHPIDGRVRTAEVVAKGNDPWSGVAIVTVKFAGEERTFDYAAERLRLVGKPFGEKRRALRALQRRVIHAIRAELGIMATVTRTVALSRPSMRRVYRKLVPEGPEGELGGFAVPGTRRAFASSELSAFDPTTRVHETLHTLSESFGSVAPRWLDEGMTEYFALGIALRQFGAQPNPDHEYYHAAWVCQELGNRIGQPLIDIVFGYRPAKERFKELTMRVDAALGKGAFARLDAAMQQGDWATVEAMFPPGPGNVGQRTPP